MLELMSRHPRSVGETYGQHLMAAWSIAGALLAASFACLIHGLAPFTFETTASRAIRRLHSHISQRSTSKSRPVAADVTA